MAKQENAMSEERKAQLRVGRLRSEAKVRAMKHYLVTERQTVVESAEFRAKFGTNSLIAKAIGFVIQERIKWKLNENGTPMSIDDEIEYRRRHGLNLLKHHYEHLGIEAPVKGKKQEEAGPITREELESLKGSLTQAEYDELEEQVAA